jgi:hypothetical protein
MDNGIPKYFIRNSTSLYVKIGVDKVICSSLQRISAN